MAEYRVKFEVFEGPLDLLLYLIKKEEVDIYEVNLTRLATQFIEYIELMREFDLEVAGEFVVMAATLMHIKSRELLPVEQRQSVEGEEEGPDPRWELIQQLVAYKKFKDAAARLQELEERQEAVFPRRAALPDLADEPVRRRPDVSLFDLLNAVNQVLQRFARPPDTRDLFEDKWTVSQKIEFILQTVPEGASARFADLFGSVTSRMEVVATFLALLELIRLGQIRAVQTEEFGDILLVRLPAAPPTSPAEAATDAPASAAAGVAGQADEARGG